MWLYLFIYLFDWLIDCCDIVSLDSRGCTDIVCCILFILAVLGYIAVGILGKRWKYPRPPCVCGKILTWVTLWVSCTSSLAAWTQGDPRKVIYPTDSRGQFCGQAGTPLEWVVVYNTSCSFGMKGKHWNDTNWTQTGQFVSSLCPDPGPVFFFFNDEEFFFTQFNLFSYNK